MKKVNIIKVISVLTVGIGMGIIFIYHKNNELKHINISKNGFTEQIKSMNAISMMYETSAGSGVYEISEDSTWLSEEYVFNENLSKCENGGTLTWNEETKRIVLTTNTSDKCYVYFDVKISPTLGNVCVNQNMASCFKENAMLDSSILHHDSSLENGANDGSYRYSGSNPNNYICFGSSEESCPDANLYRIIGVFNSQVKLIKASNATTAEIGTIAHKSENNYYWIGSSSACDTTWSNSTLNKDALNGTYLTNLGTT